MGESTAAAIGKSLATALGRVEIGAEEFHVDSIILVYYG